MGLNVTFHSFLFVSLVAASTGLSSSSAQAQAPNPSLSKSNLDISANLALLGGYSTRPDEDHLNHLDTGISVQEVELRLSANADPHFRLDVGLAGHTDEGEIAVEFEEIYLSTLDLTDITVRLGKFRVNFGKANLQHAHARRFINAPLPLTKMFGSDHILGTGISLDYLAPLPFFTELNLQVVHSNWGEGGHQHGTTSTATVSSSESDNAHLFSYIAHLKTFFELSDATSLEFGLSGLLDSDAEGDWRYAWGADLSLKWVPAAAARYTSLEWITEYMSNHSDGSYNDGLYTGIRYQTNQQWWLQQRGGLVGVSTDADDRSYRAESLIAFAPSEKTALRLQYAFEDVLLASDHSEHDHMATSAHDDHRLEPVHEVFLQFIVSIGAHPAHAY
jgi:hypothetical protein